MGNEIEAIVANGLKSRDDPNTLSLGTMCQNFNDYLKRIGLKSRYYDTTRNSQLNGLETNVALNVICLNKPFGKQAVNVFKDTSGSVKFETGHYYWQSRGDVSYFRFRPERTVLEVKPDQDIYNHGDFENILAQVLIHLITSKQNVETIMNTKSGKPALKLIKPAYDPFDIVDSIASNIKEMTGTELPVRHHSEKRSLWSFISGGSKKSDIHDNPQEETHRRSHLDMASDFKNAVDAIEFTSAELQEIADQVVEIAEKSALITQQAPKAGNMFISPLAKKSLSKTFVEMDMLTPVIASVKPEDQKRAFATLSKRFDMALEELGSARIQAATTELDIILNLREAPSVS